MSRHKDQQQQLRQQIAVMAARIMVEEQLSDHTLAKRKAAQRLGVSANQQTLPSNEEVEDALKLHQSLFNSQDHADTVRELRQNAVQAMRFFAQFKPKLVGGVLDGTAQKGGGVCLHLFVDQVEEVDWFLLQKEIPFEMAQVRLRMQSGKDKDSFPAYRFLADGVPYELVVFPAHGSHQAPLSTVTGKPIERASIKKVEQLLVETQPSDTQSGG